MRAPRCERIEGLRVWGLRAARLGVMGLGLIYLAGGTALVASAAEEPRNLHEAVLELSKQAGIEVILAAEADRRVAIPQHDKGPEAAREVLMHVVESQDWQLLDGPHGVRVAVPTEAVARWPQQWVESAWVRERCTGEAEVSVSYEAANPVDVLLAMDRLTVSGFVLESAPAPDRGARPTLSGENVDVVKTDRETRIHVSAEQFALAARALSLDLGARLTIAGEHIHAIPALCQIVEAALLLVGLEIEPRGDDFVVRPAR